MSKRTGEQMPVLIDGKRYLRLEEFAEQCGVKISTVRKRSKEIPGSLQVDADLLFPYGSRWPYSIKRWKKLDDSGKKRAALLTAIKEYKYVDHAMLGVYEESFDRMLKEFVKAGLIAENGIGNTYGANGYDCTMLGDEYVSLPSDERVRRIARLLGTFEGAMMKELATV